jgi:Tol biopolymer transport system component
VSVEVSYIQEIDPTLTLSLYMPVEKHAKPLTLLVYGGEGFPELVTHFANQGYPVITFQPRNDSYLSEIRDGFCALAWAHENAEVLGFSNHIIPVGGSMWGGNAAILGLVDDPTSFLQECPYTLSDTDPVRAVITLAGVFDYSKESDFFPGFIEAITGYMEGRPDKVPENWAEASAITWVQGDHPPFLLIHGTADTNVSPSQSEVFAAALVEVGMDAELYLLPGVNHSTSVNHPNVLEKMDSYLTRLAEADRFNHLGVTGTIAFVSNKDGDYEIYLKIIPPAYRGPASEVQLTDNEAEDTVPEWSPDGRRIVFTSNRDGNQEIYVMDIQERIQNPRDIPVLRLTNNNSQEMLPVWSPDGSQIAFASDRDGDFEIYIMQEDGTNIRQLTDNARLDNKPSWSPDGKKIVFDSGYGFQRDIFIMDVNGDNQELVVQAEGGWPDWSSDGAKIAYFDRVDGRSKVFIINIDGTHRKRIAYTNLDEWEPSWSLEGDWLLFVAGTPTDIYMIRIEDMKIFRLTSDEFEYWAPAWKPETPK